jgi:hypothetical protein
MPEGEHRHQWRHHGHIPGIAGERRASQGGAGFLFGPDDAKITSRNLLIDEWEGDAGNVGAATSTSNDYVGMQIPRK